MLIAVKEEKEVAAYIESKQAGDPKKMKDMLTLFQCEGRAENIIFDMQYVVHDLPLPDDDGAFDLPPPLGFPEYNNNNNNNVDELNCNSTNTVYSRIDQRSRNTRKGRAE